MFEAGQALRNAQQSLAETAERHAVLQGQEQGLRTSISRRRRSSKELSGLTDQVAATDAALATLETTYARPPACTWSSRSAWRGSLTWQPD